MYWLATSGGRIPVVAVCVCTGNYVFVASHIRQFCKREQKESPQKRLVKFPILEAKSKQFFQATHMPTPRHFWGTTAHQIYIIKYRNKHVQIAILKIYSLVGNIKMIW